MRGLNRQAVVQALWTLGVRLSGEVTSNRFEEARQTALEGFKRLMLETHPDRHAAAGHTKQATARAQEISAAQHLIKQCSWGHVAQLFSAEVRIGENFGFRGHRATSMWTDDWNGQVDRWKASARDVASGRPGSRGAYYSRCKQCGLLHTEGNGMCSGSATPEPPKCGAVSPMGATCTEPRGHDGVTGRWHRGFGSKGRHAWRTAESVDGERVEVEEHT